MGLENGDSGGAVSTRTKNRAAKVGRVTTTDGFRQLLRLIACAVVERGPLIAASLVCD